MYLIQKALNISKMSLSSFCLYLVVTPQQIFQNINSLPKSHFRKVTDK